VQAGRAIPVSGIKMSKRQKMRELRQRKQRRTRLLTILFGVIGALLISLILILPNLNLADVNNITQITPLSSTIPVNKTSMGKPDAPVKMDVWEDFQCSGFLSYTKNIEPQILKTYVETGKVYYTFHFFPFIDGGQGESFDSANAALCAAEQGRFWDYHAITFANWIGENAGSYTRPRLIAFAQNIGLDMNAFKQCFQANTYSAYIQQDMEEGSKLGVPPTPGIFVNGKTVVSSAGPNYVPSFDDISHAIEAGLSGK
jgi:protein-disulfide isomerase